MNRLCEMIGIMAGVEERMKYIVGGGEEKGDEAMGGSSRTLESDDRGNVGVKE